MMPFARIEAANSSRRSGRKMVLGWTGFGVMASMGRVRPFSALEAVCAGGTGGADGLFGRSVDRPLPSGLCVFSVPVLILKYFPCQLNITLRARERGSYIRIGLPWL